MSVPAEQMAPYSPVEALQRTTQSMYPDLQQFGVRPDAANAPVMGNGGPGGPAGGTNAGGPTFSQTLQAATAAKGGKLERPEIEEIRNRYIDDHVTPGLWSQKGMNKSKYEALKSVFDNKSERTIEAYLAQTSGPAATKPATERGNVRGFLEGLRDTAATTLTSATGGVLGGALHLADYGARYGNAAIDKLRGVDASNSLSTPTMLGELGLKVDRGTAAADKALVSDATLAARQKLADLIDKDASADEIATHIVNNASSLTGILGMTAGMLSPAFATKIPKVAQALELLKGTGKLGEIAAKAAPIVAAGAPIVGQAGAQQEAAVMAAPLQDLLTSPEAKQLYDLTQGLGLSEKVFRQRMASSGLWKTLAASAIANILLPGVNPLAVEKQIAGQVVQTGSRLARGLRTAGAGALEEGAAGGIEQVGQNLAQQDAGMNTPTGKGVGTQMALGAGLGGLVEGGVAALHASTPTATPTPENTPPPAAEGTTNTPPPAAAGTASTPPPPTVIPPGPGIAPEEAAIATTTAARDIKATTAGRGNIAKAFAAAATPEEVMQMADAWASQRPNWEQMDAGQRQDVLEAIAPVIGKRAGQDVRPLLQQGREALTAAPAAPVVAQTPLPPDLLATAPAPAAAAPAPVQAPPVAPVAQAAPPVVGPTVQQPTAEQPTAPVQNTEGLAPLPPNLKDAKPRYAYGARQFDLDFESEAEKALFIASNPKRLSKSDAEYLRWIRENLGYDEPTARAEGKAIGAQIKELAKNAPKGATRLAIPFGGTNTPTPVTVPTPPQKRPKPLKTAPTVETTAVPTPPQKRGKALKGESTPPKQQAPTPQPVAGAQESQPSEAPPVNQSPSEPNRESGLEAVQRILGDSIDEADAKELGAAVELARLGETGPLEQGFKELPEITAEDKRAIREAGRSLKPAERGEAETNAPSEAPYVKDANIQAEARRVYENIKGKSAEEGLQWLAENGPNKPYRYIATKVLARLKRLQARGVQFKLTIKALQPGNSGTTNTKIGTDRFKAEVVLSTRLGDNLPGTSFTTALHEYIHAVTNYMMRTAKLDSTAAVSKTAAELRRLHQMVFTHIANKPPSELTPFEREALQFHKDQRHAFNNALEDADELLAWGLTSSDMQDTLARIPYDSKKSVWTKLVEMVRDMLGLDAQYDTALDRLMKLGEDILDTSNLDEWMDGVLKQVGSNNFNESAISNSLYDSISNDAKSERHPLNVSTLQRLGEAWTNSTYGLERAEQESRKAGNTVDNDISPYIAGRLHTGHVSDILAADNDEVVNPIADYIAANWRRFSDSLPEFRKNLDAFMQAYHQLHERIPAMWLEQVPLAAGQNVTRAQLIDDANAGKITPKDFYAKLNQLVNRYATSSLADWSKQASNAKDVDALRTTLAQLKTKGFDEARLADLNALFQRVRDRQQEHMTASGRISTTDPWVKARDWKWYVPLKGDPKASETAADMDYGSFAGAAKEFRTRRIELMQGRASQADSVVEQLIADMNQEGIKHAEGQFKSSLFGFVKANLPQMGATKITPINGTLKAGFYRDVIVRDKKTGQRRMVQKPVPASEVYHEPPYGFVFHDGDTHYKVELDPKNDIAGNLDRGVKGFRNVQSPKGALKALGMATNFMARSYTTWSPEWQLLVGFLRDTNFIPAMVAMDLFDSPLKAGKFMRGYTTRLLGNTVQLANLKKTLQEIAGRKDLLRERAKANPDSFEGQLFAYHEAGGSTEFAQSLNAETAGNAIFGKSESKSLAGKALTGYRKFNEWTSNWAQVLENKGRVAAFTTLVKDMGMDPRQAASTVKGAMDFGQSGEYGRMANAWIAFFRMGATSVDAMRRVFTTPTGKPNWPKLTKWASFMSGIAIAGLGMMGLALGDDDEGKPRIRKFDINTLTQKMIIPTGDGEVASYPIGLGLPQLLMAPGTIGYMLSHGYITQHEAANAMYDTITRNLPFQPAGWADGSGVSGFLNSWWQALAPTPLRPVTETVANLNSWDGTIHTPFKDDTKARSEQGLQATPQEWKDMAKELNKFGIDMYPEDIRHFAKGYGGQNATTVMRYVADNPNAEDAGIDSRAVRTSLRLAVKDEDFYYTRQLKNAERVLLNTQQRYKAADTQGEIEAFNADPANKRRLEALKALESAKKVYYDNLTKIRNANISVQGKRDRRKLADSGLRQAVERAQGVIEATD